MRGPIAWMARNSVAANLLMLVILIAGALGITRITQEVFPSFEMDIVAVSIPYPGASPEEVEQGLILAIEEAVRGLDGVKHVTSTATESVGAVQVEMRVGADAQKGLAEVKTAVDRIQTFPEDAERPKVQLIKATQRVISIVISGDHELQTLHQIGEDVRTQLITHPDITSVELLGVPPLEVSIEVRRETLEALGMTMNEVAQQIQATSLELPGGTMETSSGEVLVRVADRRLTQQDFADVLIRSTANGSQLRLGDIATITDGYADNKQATYFNGKRAVDITAFRVGDENPMKIAKAVKEQVQILRSELPATVAVDVWVDESQLLEGRIGLLVRNARIGLFLVLLILALFLELRLAFWVGLGIPISFLGSFLLMPAMDISINMISLFGLIVTLGMVVDDAIIVGEAAYTKMQEGMERQKAAIEGAREMSIPVTFAILTTIAAFSPMFFVPGFSGKLFGILPAVIVAVLIFSLIESFFILPAHLSHTPSSTSLTGRFVALLSKVADPPRIMMSDLLLRFTKHRYAPILVQVVRWRYVAASSAVGVFILTLAIVVSGRIPFSFMPNIESELVTVSARLPFGAPIERTQQVQKILEVSLEQTLDELGAEGMRGRIATVGRGPINGFPGENRTEAGAHLISIYANLVGTEAREFSAQQFAETWTKNTPLIPGLEALTFDSSFAPGSGAKVDLELSHTDKSVLEAATVELNQRLQRYKDLTDIESSFAAGKPRMDFKLLPSAHTLGLTSFEVGRQLRAYFYGAEALREQRGRNEIKVMLRLPDEQRASTYELAQLRIRTPMGGFVPLSSIAEIERSRAPTIISRQDGRRLQSVRAGLAAGVESSKEVLDAIKDKDLPTLKKAYPGLEVGMGGEQREQGETFASLGKNYLLAMLLIYTLLAIPFKSYIQPLVIMSAIPFGFVGAIIGHIVMGYGLSIISMFGIVALSGVVVNDSLVLVDTANRARREGSTAFEAITWAGARRLRPILLTSLTTFFGLAPMIFETSIQARFLIPMAISLGFGVLFATVIVLLLVPAFYMMVEDVRGWVNPANK